MDAITEPGTLSKVYVDREHVKRAQGDARPWVVENDNATYRCRVIERLDGANSRFDINGRPALWLETRKPVAMQDVEIIV